MFICLFKIIFIADEDADADTAVYYDREADPDVAATVPAIWNVLYIIENNLAWAKEWSALRHCLNIDEENRLLLIY